MSHYCRGAIPNIIFDKIIDRYGEKVVGTLNSLVTAVFDYPISALKDSARPGVSVS